jgi:hypothetical protein
MMSKKIDLIPISLRCFTKRSEKEEGRLQEKAAKREERRKKKQAKQEVEALSAAIFGQALQQHSHDPGLEDYIRDIGAPWPYGMTICDFETATGCMTGQRLRFGYFQRRGMQYDSADPAKDTILKHAKARTLTREMLDRLTAHGIVYNRAGLSESELATLKRFVDDYNARRHVAMMPLLKLITVETFVTRHLLQKRYANWYKRIRDPHMIIGHNIIFDLGAMATHTTKSRGTTYGGLSMTLCNCAKDENGKTSQCGKRGVIIAKKIGPKKYFYRRSERRPDPLTVSPKEQALSIVDTMTLAKTLGGAGTPASLEELTWKFNTPHKKSPENHGQELTPEYIEYCMNDVQATFEVFQALRAQYKAYDLDRPFDKLYSTASVGKALLEKLGVVPFAQAHPNFDYKIAGIFAEGYSGGRSNLDCRHQVRQCVYVDGKSEYPSANGLMDNQSLLLAESIDVKWDDPETKAFLESLDIHKLLMRETWPRLKGMAFIEPDSEILQIRANFDSGNPTVSNVGTVKVRSGPPIWISFPDLAYSLLMTGKCPTILKTVELIPIGRRATHPLNIMGDPDYRIDLSLEGGQDLFVRPIDLRTKLKKQIKGISDPQERDRLKGIETFLKEVANSCSYGILIEMILDESSETQEIDIFYGDQKHTRRPHAVYTDDNGDRVRNDFSAELPGKYNAPFGTLITAGARLLLGITEYLGKESGIESSACDTDSLCLLKPSWMDEDVFLDSIHYIVQKLQALNLYKCDDFFLKVETQNFRLRDDLSGEADEPPPQYVRPEQDGAALFLRH